MKRLLLALLSLCGCAHQERFLPATRPVEKALVFTEIGSRSAERKTSAPDASGSASRVPQPATLDVDSTLRIEVRKDLLVPESLRPLDGRIEAGREGRAKLEQTLDALRQAQTAEQTALEAFARTEQALPAGEAEGALERFVAARREFAARELAVNDRVLALWRGTPHENALEAAAEEDDTWNGLRAFVRERLAEVDAANAALESLLAERRLALRLSAALVSADGQETFLHLPGYDTLPEGTLQPFDRTGTVLTPSERAKLAARWAQTVDIASALEALNRGEADVRATLQRLLPVLAPELRTAVEDLGNATADLDALRRDVQTVNDALPRLGDALAGAVAEAASDAVREAQRELAALLGLPDLAEKTRSLAQRYRQLRPEDAFTLVVESATLLQRFGGDVRELLHRGLPGDATLLAWFVARADVVDDDVESALRTELAKPEWNDVRAAGERVVRLLRAVARLARVAAELGRSAHPIPDPLHPPQAVAVPLDEIRDTHLDMTLVPRERGDRIVVRGSLLRDDQVLDETKASFAVDAFGWQGTLSPAVVLARPDSLGGADPNFGFAPSLSWLHGYRPRPDESGLFAGFMRGFAPSAGLHAVFLNIDPDKEVEIGLGATFALWGNRLQGGIGYNLMHDDGIGEIYYFVGSDLIALLQDAGAMGR